MTLLNLTGHELRLRDRLLIALPLLSVVPALAVASIFIWGAGVSPFAALDALFKGAFGTPSSIGVTALRTTPLLIAGLGVAIGMRAGLWNLGAEGQILMGGLGATVVALALPFHSGPAAIFISLVGGFVGGALWASIPAALRVFRSVSEVITGLLLNFVAINIISILVTGPLEDPLASFPASPRLPEELRLPVLLKGTQLHAGLIIALLLAVIVFLILQSSQFGIELRAVGHNPKAARFAGIALRRRMMQALLLGGGLAGIAGAVEILGLHHRLVEGFSPGFGFDAIAVALLGASDPRYMVGAALFFGSLRAGAPAMERVAAVPSELIFLTQGAVILFVVAAYGLRRRVMQRSQVMASETTK